MTYTHSVALLSTRDRSVAAGTSTWQHTTLTRHRHPCFRRDSNRQCQQESDADPRLTPRGHRSGYHERTKRNVLQALTFMNTALRIINCSIWSVLFSVQWVTDRLRVEFATRIMRRSHILYAPRTHVYVSGSHYRGSVSLKNRQAVFPVLLDAWHCTT